MIFTIIERIGFLIVIIDDIMNGNSQTNRFGKTKTVFSKT